MSRVVEVGRIDRLTDHMVRVVFGGELDGFVTGAFTDHYVKIQFPDGERTRTRTYTVRHFDAGRQELTIDFVVHGDAGVAGPWAMTAKPGDTLRLQGPGGGYTPRADADWHLLVGDDSVVPAVAATLEQLPDDAVAHVVLAAEPQPLPAPAGTTIHWVDDVRTAIAVLEFPPGAPQVFLHGEADDVREVRRHLVLERGVPREGQSISGYWKQRRTEEGWREDKPAWNRLIEQDDQRGAIR